MIEEQKTKELFGYSYENLTNGSSKPIILICDYCKNQYNGNKKNRLKANSIVNKDSCKNCRFKKREDVSMARDGVKNSAQRKDVLEKLSDINWDNIKTKIIEMIKEGYSSTYISNQLNIPITSLNRKLDAWNVDYKEIFTQKERTKKTINNKNDFYKNRNFKTKNTMLKKYGVENAFQMESTKQAIISNNIKKYGVEWPSQDPNVAKERAKKCRKTKISNGQMRIYKDKSIAELAEKYGFSKSHFNYLVNKYGFELACSKIPKESDLEMSIRIWLSSQNIKYKSQVKIDKYYADFLIDDVVIEADGLYWHSESNKPNNYHTVKRNKYVELGYRPLFFRENEIKNKMSIVSSIILNSLGMTKNKIFARKCEIKELDKKETKSFFENNHLMGSGSGRCWGLIYDNKIVSAIRIKKVKDNVYEISRFCSLLNTSVIGGFSKLLSHIEKQLNIYELKTFIDLRYGNGFYLNDFGFEPKKLYPSFRWTDGNKDFHRLKFKGNSGYEAGYVKIWDCGQQKFIKQYGV